MDNIRTTYIWEDNLIKCCDCLPAVPNRASIVHSLIMAYGLLHKIKVIKSQPASYTEMKLFHSDLYLDHLKTLNNLEEDYIPSAQDEEFGLGYDCPPVSDMYNLVSTVAGGSVTAAKTLVMDIADVAINWCGGWHHANRSGAEGFCYVNDAVIAIEMLRRKFPKVLYIDLDVHHGNGVQDAYNLSKSVFTLSFHKYEPGFYPGSGNIDDIGTLNGKGYSCNFPLHALYTNDKFILAFDSVFEMIFTYFTPDAIVVQCGADALAGDPYGGAGLTADGYSSCVQKILHKKKPTMLLGGGGYNHTNASKLWTSITAQVIGVTLDNNIPEHKFWTKYGADYTLKIQPLLTKDLNTNEYINKCINSIKENLNKYLNQDDNSVTGELNIKRIKIALEEKPHEAKINSKFKRKFFQKNVEKENHSKTNKSNENIKKLLNVYDFVD